MAVHLARQSMKDQGPLEGCLKECGYQAEQVYKCVSSLSLGVCDRSWTGRALTFPPSNRF